MMQSHNSEETQVIEVSVVHAMFKRLEECFDEKIKEVKRECMQQIKTPSQETDLCKKISDMELEEDVRKCAALKMCGDIDELAERIGKLELDNLRKMITISGLYADTEKMDIARRQVDSFIAEKLGINLKIDSCYHIGTAVPKTLVVTLHSIREKEKVMRHKSYLKGYKNKDGKPYYVNNFYAPVNLESRRKHREMVEKNENAGEEKVEMQTKGKNLLIEGTKYQGAIQPPKAQQIIDMTVEEVKRIVNAKIANGPAIEKEMNKFTGYSADVESLQQIRDVYMKLRLAHPKARHIMCAYQIEDQEEKYYDRSRCCDDGEHGASSKLLEILTGNRISQKAIFVVRYYSGQKIGPARFTCICEAAEECIKLNPYNEILGENQYVHHDEEISQPSQDESETAVKFNNEREAREEKMDTRTGASRKEKKTYRGRNERRGGARNNYPGAGSMRSRQNSSPEEVYHKKTNYEYGYDDYEDWENSYSYERDYPQINPWNGRGSGRGRYGQRSYSRY